MFTKLNPQSATRRLGLAGLLGFMVMALIYSSPVLGQSATPTWRYTSNLNTSRSGHTATLLRNGKVLVAGGMDTNGHPLTSAELYDPDAGSWSLTGDLNVAHSYHTATLLPNDKVLIVGGNYNVNAELYDPASGTWTITAQPATSLNCAIATLLPNGKVLVVDVCGQQAELYDAANGTWSITGQLAATRYGATATLLNNGKILVAGGDSAYGCGSALNSVELYDPATGTWSTTGALNTGHEYHSATLLGNGKVLVAGGFDSIYNATSSELYDPLTGTWTMTGNLTGERAFFTTTTLLNGKVLAVGGVDSQTSELYDPASGVWNNSASLNSNRNSHTATLLPNGKVLVAGGTDPYGYSLLSAELFDPGGLNQIDDAQTFVRQHYLDFLNREPDAGGLAYWTNRIAECGSDERCIRQRRIGVSAAFFIELEFQDTGYYVYRFYKASFGRQPNFAEFTADRSRIVVDSNLEANKQAFADEWVQRPAFLADYPLLLSNTEVVNRLFQMAGLGASTYDAQRQQEIQLMNSGRSRALVLRDVIELPDFRNIPDPHDPRYAEIKLVSQYNPAFVLMQYFGYLRRNVDEGGYDFWLDVINNREPNNYSSMVCAFVTSREYQLRFGSVVTRSNAECGQ